MSQEERDWLDWLKRARDGSVTQKQAAEKMGVTDRWVRNLLASMKERGDAAVVHGVRGKQVAAQVFQNHFRRKRNQVRCGCYVVCLAASITDRLNQTPQGELLMVKRECQSAADRLFLAVLSAATLLGFTPPGFAQDRDRTQLPDKYKWDLPIFIRRMQLGAVQKKKCRLNFGISSNFSKNCCPPPKCLPWA